MMSFLQVWTRTACTAFITGNLEISKMIIQATSKGSDQTARMRRLILGFAGGNIVGNLMLRLKCVRFSKGFK